MRLAAGYVRPREEANPDALDESVGHEHAGSGVVIDVELRPTCPPGLDERAATWAFRCSAMIGVGHEGVPGLVREAA
jgi:hypothetical protein